MAREYQRPKRLRDRLNPKHKGKKRPEPVNALLWIDDTPYRLLEVEYGFMHHTDGAGRAIGKLCLKPFIAVIKPIKDHGRLVRLAWSKFQTFNGRVEHFHEDGINKVHRDTIIHNAFITGYRDTNGYYEMPFERVVVLRITPQYLKINDAVYESPFNPSRPMEMNPKGLLSMDSFREEEDNDPLVHPNITAIEGPYDTKDQAVNYVTPDQKYAYYAILENPNIDVKQVHWAVSYDDEGIEKSYKLFSGGTIVNGKLRIYAKIDKAKTKFKLYAYTGAMPKENLSVEVPMVRFPIYIDKYKKAGYDISGTALADDLHYGDGVHLNTGHSKYTIEEIKALSTLFYIQLNLSDGQLWSELRSMVTTVFSIGELETVALRMLDHFKGNSGTEFSDPILTKYIIAHPSTTRFCNSMEGLITERLQEKKLNLNDISYRAYNKTDIPRTTDTDWGHPHYSTLKDTFLGGLRICMNDVWSFEMLIKNIQIKENKWNITYTVKLYDHFGLDKPDVEKIYQYGAGFRAWFVLQHVRNYKPFITTVEFDKTFEYKP